MLKNLLERLFKTDSHEAALTKAFKGLNYPQRMKNVNLAGEILTASPEEQRQWALAIIAWEEHNPRNYKKDDAFGWHGRWQMQELLEALLKKRLPFSPEDVTLIGEWGKARSMYSGSGCAALNKVFENYLKDLADQPAHPAVITVYETLCAKMLDGDPAAQRFGHKLRMMLEAQGSVAASITPSPLLARDAWAAAAAAEIAALPASASEAWNRLLVHCAQAKSSSPSAKWLAQAATLRTALTAEGATFLPSLERWFALVDQPGVLEEDELGNNEAYHERLRWEMRAVNGDILKGLVWLCADLDDPAAARLLGALAKDAFRKLPGVGPRLARVGNAVIWALGVMPGRHGLAQLALLKTRLKMPNMQKQIEAAFNAAARRLNLSPDEIEELVVPDYGMQTPGERLESFGEYRAAIVMDAGEPVLQWFKGESDKPLASAPKTVKADYPDEVKALVQAVKDIKSMLTAQRDRLDRLFLAQKNWRLPDWQARYLDHPLVGILARRLIWKFSHRDRAASGIWLDGKLVGRDGQALDWLDDDTRVELWHPLSVNPEIVLEWRRLIEAHQIVQPFKQAHREVYVLTEAERQTRVYSNRFAAHILRQHQFNALCAARGWKNQLRLMVDATYPAPYRVLENWGLRVEYWIEAVGNNYGVDTTDTGTYLYIATDHVRFYAIHAAQRHAHAAGGGYAYGGVGENEALSLDVIPPLVFSELMRDVDLFVGVASVGNDPTWSDGGPDGRHVTYWQHYAFGELGESAKTRRQVLEMLLPRLKIAGRCHLTERFLLVRGDLRSYKIHLGSGNILMEPNDQYLCIVPKSSVAIAGERLMLPFEGDQMLAVILSKAFLLADDRKITDTTITSQIARR